MPYSVDEKHSPSEFYSPEETNYPNATFQGEDNAEQSSNKNGQEKCFLVFSTKSEQIAIQQSHIINPLLTSFAPRSVRERQYFPVQTSGNTFPQAILSRTDLALG